MPVLTEPSGLKSAAFQSETLVPCWFVTSIRSPSNAAVIGPSRPLPVRLARTVPVDALTTVTESESVTTQMFVPSKTGNCGLFPTITN